MSASVFCDNLRSELDAWKVSVLDILTKFESQPGYAKVGVHENVEDIRILVQEMEARVDQLKESCSLAGFDDINIEREKDRQASINVRDVDSAVGAISGGNFGG